MNIRFRFFLLFAFSILVSCKQKTLFEQITSAHSGIHFNNKIIEDDFINPLNNTNIYNGGGIGVGDFNKDGLQDLFFVGNRVANKLYLNRGDFKFDDITVKAGVSGSGHWGRGVAVIDINNDGWPDIYVSNTMLSDSMQRTNQLYINQGTDKNGIPVFKEMAKEYGLDIHAHSTMANFFDYDNDGDLDMYLAVNEIPSGASTIIYRPQYLNRENPSTGRLYRNDWDPILKHGVYHDVSKAAGVNAEGYAHGATIVDINKDGWKDIYITNDFIASNILYINNHDGTFTDRSKEYFKHTSSNAMGQDIEDINNDGLADVVELDMNPADNFRKKMMLNTVPYQSYLNIDFFHYQYQYVRNTLQLNQGPRVGENDSVKAPAFSEISWMAGMAQTDWSWCPLLHDFNNDGFRDLIITNGFPRDLTDHDFMVYRNKAFTVASNKQLLDQIPVIKIPNYAFENNTDLTFKDVTKDWGLTLPTFSNGATYADLNNDGATDLIISNINDEALVYKNTSNDAGLKAHYLNINFAGGSRNINGIGAWADIYYNRGKHQVYENTPYRGYLSSIQNIAHFGLGSQHIIDSLVIRWQNGYKQLILNPSIDRILTVRQDDARLPYSFASPAFIPKSLVREITSATGIKYKHTDRDFIDFNVQKLIPHKLSEYTPALAAADLNGDGLDDLIIGGYSQAPAQIFFQQTDGKFSQRKFSAEPALPADNIKDAGILVFDANGDGKPDVYMASGGYENQAESPFYQDRLYLNDGKGNFKLEKNALPQNLSSKLCVRAFDYNNDGKTDLFVSGRVAPWHYPQAVSSFIFRNDSKNGIVKFTDVTHEVAPELEKIGLVCDALFTDFDNDGKVDLILAGEWMPLTFFKNVNGKFKNVTARAGNPGRTGWWNTIVAGDFNNDGKTDYVVGNAGLNSFYQASEKYPVSITAGDFDRNGNYSAIPSVFLPDINGQLKEFPVAGREDMIKQLISMRRKFPTYRSYALATMAEVLDPDQQKQAIKLSSNTLTSCYYQNLGNGKFSMTPLPQLAQISSLDGMIAKDLDGDGNLDLVLSGNDFGNEILVGRADAFNGLVLKGNGMGQFKPLSILESGFYLPGNSRALVSLTGARGNLLMAASGHKSALKIFELKRTVRNLPILPRDLYAIIRLRNGKSRKEEFYYGSSFLSQSSRYLMLDQSILSVSITDMDGRSRILKL